MREDKPGESLQRLVRLIELGVGNNDQIAVRSPCMLKDRDTGQLREHDVVVEIRSGHHKLVVALECRDRSRKVSVPEVEAFSDKCRSTGVDQGILVSSKGFASTALAKARSRGLRCLTFDEVETLDWVSMRSLSIVSRTIHGVFLQLGFEGVQPAQTIGLQVILDGEREFDKDVALNTARLGLDQITPDLSVAGLEQEVWFDIEIDPKRRPVARDAAGEDFSVARAALRVRYSISVEERPFTFGQYNDRTAGTEITEAAIATLEVHGRPANLVVVANRDGTKTVKLVFD